MWITWVGWGASLVLVPKGIINIIGYCGAINRRLIGSILGVVLDKCRDVIDV